MKKMNKKGDASSLIISLVVILFVIGIVSLLFSKVFTETSDALQSNPQFSNRTIQNLEMVESKTIPFLDYLFFFSFIAISLGLIISSIFIDTHPVFAVIFIVVLVVAIILAGLFANIYTDIGENSELSSTYDQFTLTKALMNHFPLIVFVIGLIVTIILYGKTKAGGMSP